MSGICITGEENGDKTPDKKTELNSIYIKCGNRDDGNNWFDNEFFTSWNEIFSVLYRRQQYVCVGQQPAFLCVDSDKWEERICVAAKMDTCYEIHEQLLSGGYFYCCNNCTCADGRSKGISDDDVE